MFLQERTIRLEGTLKMGLPEQVAVDVARSLAMAGISYQDLFII